MSEARIAWAAVTIDARDPGRLAAFYADLIGAPVVPVGDDRPGWCRVGPAVPGGPVIAFQPVAEAGPSARIHLDLWVSELDDAIARVVELGGRPSRAVQVLARGRIAVMADPEGNELCLLAAPTGG